ncbi:hypothetical protein PENTCL1PPCAC_25049, partial [Pristionchus entomophagus]
NLLMLLALFSIVFAAFENCPDQEEFDSCADIEIDRIMTNSTVMENSELKGAEYKMAMAHCWKKHCV